MKRTMIIVALLFGMNSYGQQTQRRNLYKGTFDISEKIYKEDTTTFFYFGFQNAKYQHITDIGGIGTSSKEQMKEFAEVLKEYSGKENGISMEYQTKIGLIYIYDFSKNVYIQSRDGKYTMMTKKKASAIADEMLSNLHLLR